MQLQYAVIQSIKTLFTTYSSLQIYFQFGVDLFIPFHLFCKGAGSRYPTIIKNS